MISHDHNMTAWRPSLDKEGPLYLQMAQALETDIRKGILSPGTRLPPQRTLADELGINLSTVARAFKLCMQKGLLSATVGSGTYVAFDAGSRAILVPDGGFPNTIEMGALFPEQSPNREVAEQLKRLLGEPDSERLLQYGEGGRTGTPGQQEAAAMHIRQTGYMVEPDGILLANGTQNAIAASLAALFKPGDKIGTDALTYPGIKTAAQMLGIQLTPLPGIEGNYAEECLNQALRADGIKGLYLIPDFHNPTTRTMPLATRQRLGHWVKKHNLIVLEDAIQSLFASPPLPPVASFAPEQVIYMASVSKTLSPGLRLSFLAVPRQYRKALSTALYNINIAPSPLMAELAARLIRNGMADQILQQRKTFVRLQNESVDRILAGYEIEGTVEATFRWLKLPEGWSGDRFELQAYRAGVQVYAADRFAVMTQPQAAVRLSITGPGSQERLEEGLHILRCLLEDGVDAAVL